MGVYVCFATSNRSCTPIAVSFYKTETKMGTYTTNYQLYMPTVGEQGWGDLVNGNFATIDTTIKSLSNRITAVENEVNGNLSCTSVATSGTITSTGLITGNGGIKGNLTGNVTGLLFVKGTVGTSGNENYATLAAQSVSMTTQGSSSSPGASITVNNYSISYGNPKKHSVGIYTRRSDLSGTTSPSVSTRTITFTVKQGSGSAYLSSSLTSEYVYYKKSTDSSWISKTIDAYMAANTTQSFTITGTVNATYQFYTSFNPTVITSGGGITISIGAGTTYKVTYVTP